MRVYLPATLPTLRIAISADSGRQLAAGPGFAVTPELREWYASGDTEELEYIALSLAAAASLELLVADPAASRRRVVVAAEVAESAVTILQTPVGGQRGRVTLLAPVELREIAAAHIDGDVAMADIKAAAAAPDDEFAAEEAADHELLWYATQELDGLLDSL
jgi:hypothetical protein